MFLASKLPARAPFAQPLNHHIVVVLQVLSSALLVLWTIGNASASSLVEQTNLPGNCIPQFKVALPVFGPAGSIPRVDTVSHKKITVTMKEIDQAVLPVGMQSLAGEGCPSPSITFKKTRVWAYEISDTKTRKILGRANWPDDRGQEGTRDPGDVRQPVAEFQPQ
jgi:hypothetical protein